MDGLASAEDFIAYAARVSNPGNQLNTATGPKLMQYLIRNQHWSPFEQVSASVEIKTTRDIGRQILRHRSFVFQEYSQRYALAVDDFQPRELRMQDPKNRQSSIPTDDEALNFIWNQYQEIAYQTAKVMYNTCIEKGIAKEQARALLPEGLTMSTMIMTGTLRSFIHYCDLRTEDGTQKEHREIATAIRSILAAEFPSVFNEVGSEGVA